ncbi:MULTISPECIES: methionyl-tRNA formyltransferase [Clostridium]|uniref:Methionyl-tRNA formyltransferase n=1 Tax=Clostridium novyi (strain NT) TaxID=386415 RepID=FMT_CLONN|nr:MULTISPECIES: methionyl-tRNA formyltransferase [Clostridium]A0Q115.1 RecName: Full=Methionyl-tRNA formyltransferase [Clostridium novyi NT]ABK61126.1 methionyl-tRNA formyltransferase [Clostridium novyi NT]KEH85108.1 methionyl-tRNA formyltransferase [Clostridium novyi A str. NCTC 538]KEH85852.1 methionyl-tRNA formyltransferase [Clostridium novyi A str. 4540]KEH85895.1 methionyl-tRNA formyltransferase [Clostridium novyi A str. BKT29909]KEH91994.1 methionyl-tRNA formyltransferase [Clostridium 
MKIVFMGTPEFAVPSLKAMVENFNVEGVFTQPDRPKGRGKKLAMSPVKEVALENNIDVYQPVSLRKEPEFIEKLKNIQPDFIIVVAYGQILPKEVLEIPKYACINLHASLLPKYRGAAPLNWAIINGEKKSGNTTMLMDVGLDTGDMLMTQEVDINDSMTAGELHDILMIQGGDLLVDTINKMVSGEITPIKQDDSKTCYASMLDKKMACIDWSKSASEIHNLIRGLNPWPVAYTHYDDKVMKIYKSHVLNENSKKEPGTVINVSNKGIKVACGEGILVVEEIQFPGKKPLKVEQYIRGNSIEIESVLK